jgi:hypothetical protein
LLYRFAIKSNAVICPEQSSLELAGTEIDQDCCSLNKEHSHSLARSSFSRLALDSLIRNQRGEYLQKKRPKFIFISFAVCPLVIWNLLESPKTFSFWLKEEGLSVSPGS